MRWSAPAALFLPALLLALPWGARGVGVARYADAPPPAHTGGFGEPTCARCHFDQPVNDAAGTLSLEGVPAAYEPGGRYRLRVLLGRAGLGKAGFQLAARVAAGEGAGVQAGGLRPVSDRAAITTHAGVQYAHHTRTGTAPTDADTARWELDWTAPEVPGLPVVFHLAGNAAGGDDSEFDDHVYTRADTLRSGSR